MDLLSVMGEIYPLIIWVVPRAVEILPGEMTQRF